MTEGEGEVYKSRTVDVCKLRMTGFECLHYLCNPLCYAFPGGTAARHQQQELVSEFLYILMSFPIKQVRLNSFFLFPGQSKQRKTDNARICSKKILSASIALFLCFGNNGLESFRIIHG
jgi:hypothetical protein